MSLLFLFDLLGTSAFAAYGSYLAAHKQFDLFGIFVCACVSAFAGGTIRSLFLNQLPIYFTDGRYFLAVLIGILFSLLLFQHFARIQRFMLAIDALGLVTFALLGASLALDHGLGLIGALLFAVLSAVGGGVCCDLLLREIPRIFYRDFYATPAALVGLFLFLFRADRHTPLVIYSILLSSFCLRLLAIKWRLELWKPRAASPELTR